MEVQSLESSNADVNLTVDASRPFHSVKEAVAIFGERLLLREIRSSPQPPSFALQKETSYPYEPVIVATKKVVESELIQSPENAPNMIAKNVTDSSLNEPSHPSELSQSLDESPNIAGEKDVDSSVNKLSHTMKLAPSPNESPSKQIFNSSVYDVTPSPQNQKNDNHGNIVHGNDLVMMLMVLKKLEAELQETKMELKLLKERESETEVALASLNAELHKNMSKMAKAEAAEAAKAATNSMTSLEGETRETGRRDYGGTRSDMIVKNMDSPTLAQILSISDYESYFGETKVKKLMKKKPIIPLVTNMFPWRKKSSPAHDISSPLFSSHMYSA